MHIICNLRAQSFQFFWCRILRKIKKKIHYSVQTKQNNSVCLIATKCYCECQSVLQPIYSSFQFTKNDRQISTPKWFSITMKVR